MINKRLNGVLALSLITGLLLTGCNELTLSSESPNMKNELETKYGFEYVYKKDKKYKVREQERAVLGNLENITNILGEIKQIKDDNYNAPSYSGIKGVNTNLVYNKDLDKVLRVEFTGDYEQWKSETDEKHEWKNFLYDFRRLGGFKYGDILNDIIDISASEEVYDFLEEFLSESTEPKKEGRTSRVIHINDNLKVYAYVDCKKIENSEKLSKSVGIVFEESIAEVK